MNPIVREAARSLPYGWVLGLTTLVFMAGFLFWIWWAWTGKNRARWEADSRLPFNDGGDA